LLPADLPLLVSGAFISSLVLSLVGTYAVRGWAIRRGYVDHPDDARRIHSNPTPNVGGIAVAFAALVTFVIFGRLVIPDFERRPEILAMIGGSALIFVLGFWDDTHHLKARTKFVAQMVIATFAFALVTLQAVDRMSESYRLDEMLASAYNWPTWPAYLPVVLGTALLTVRSLYRTIGHLWSVFAKGSMVELPPLPHVSE